MKIGIVGAAGRMGQMLVDLLHAHSNMQLSAAFVRKESQVILPKDCLVTSDLNKFVEEIDLAIDYSSPSLTIELAGLLSKVGKPLVSGTTGLDQVQKKTLADCAQSIAIMHSGNTSIGINLVEMLLRQLACALSDYDVEIVEKHHRNKVDAPSGTALMLAHTINEARTNTNDNIICGRNGHTGTRSQDEIGINSVRAGSNVGEHEVIFASEDEIITVSHQALSRKIFASGALRAASWIINQPAGLYSMQDVLA